MLEKWTKLNTLIKVEAIRIVGGAARLGNAVENLSILRKMALQKISQMSDKLSKKKRRFRASLNNLYLIDIILN